MRIALETNLAARPSVPSRILSAHEPVLLKRPNPSRPNPPPFTINGGLRSIRGRISAFPAAFRRRTEFFISRSFGGPCPGAWPVQPANWRHPVGQIDTQRGDGNFCRSDGGEVGAFHQRRFPALETEPEIRRSPGIGAAVDIEQGLIANTPCDDTATPATASGATSGKLMLTSVPARHFVSSSFWMSLGACATRRIPLHAPLAVFKPHHLRQGYRTDTEQRALHRGRNGAGIRDVFGQLEP